jgi:uncharacterized protein (UPF0210 family)
MTRREFINSIPAAAAALSPAEPARPKVRAITGFLALDRAGHEAQLREALGALRQAKRIFEQGGYEVESVRITTQPFPEYTRGLPPAEAVAFFREYDALAARESFDPNIGPAMLRNGDDPAQAVLLGQILASTKLLAGSLIIGGENGIYWNAVRAAAGVIKYLEERSPGSIGNFNFAATAMLEPYAPFFPGSYHTGPGRRFSAGTEGANLVAAVFAETGGDSLRAAERLSRALNEHAITLDRLARQAAKETGWEYMGLDATPAPLADVSIGAAIEKFIGGRFGSSGTMTAADIITRAVQSITVKRAGYSGLMLPVMEDSLLARRWAEGAYGVDALLAYSAVCGTGLDTIPMAGGAPVAQIERIMGDVATLAIKWRKPLSARLLPVKGKKVGDRTEFDDPFLVNTTIQAVR